MSLTTHLLLQETSRFARHKLTTLLLLSVWGAMGMVCLLWLFQQCFFVQHGAHMQQHHLRVVQLQILLHLMLLPLLHSTLLVVLQNTSSSSSITPWMALKKGVHYYTGLLIVELVTIGVTALGLLAGLIPGIIVALRWSLAPCIAINCQQRPLITWLRESWRATADYWRPLLAGQLILQWLIYYPLWWLLNQLVIVHLNNPWFAIFLGYMLFNVSQSFLLIYRFHLYNYLSAR